MNYTNEVGVFERVTVTGTLVSIGVSGGKAALLGVNVGSSNGTGPMVQIWQGQVTGSTTLLGLCTLPVNAFTRIPAYCSGGAVLWFSNNEAPDITIYWNPLG